MNGIHIKGSIKQNLKAILKTHHNRQFTVYSCLKLSRTQIRKRLILKLSAWLSVEFMKRVWKIHENMGSELQCFRKSLVISNKFSVSDCPRWESDFQSRKLSSSNHFYLSDLTFKNTPLSWIYRRIVEISWNLNCLTGRKI